MALISTVRKPAVAGQFYPAGAQPLRRQVERLLEAARPRAGGRPPKALIAPHAGYVYSGPVAASAYAEAEAGRGTFTRVVLLGPSHHFAFRGLAATSATACETPLGLIPVDRAALDQLADLAGVHVMDDVHLPEHSLEVQLPFLQLVLDAFTLVPLVTGEAAPGAVAAVLDRLWGGAETLIVASSDLSHYHSYETARRLDAATCTAIEGFDDAALSPNRACGCVAVAGLLAAARARGMAVRTLDLRNSGDTAGPRDSVVGYGAWAFFE